MIREVKAYDLEMYCWPAKTRESEMPIRKEHFLRSGEGLAEDPTDPRVLELPRGGEN